MGEKVVNITIRFPEPVRDRVKSFAGRDRRSLNAEVIALLEEAMNAREQKPGDSPRFLRCADTSSGYTTT